MSASDRYREGSESCRDGEPFYTPVLGSSISLGGVWFRWVAVLCVAAGTFALCSAPALAAGVRSKIGDFGPDGPGGGVFSAPQGIAVEQSSHDVFVYDVGGGGRIYKFNAAGEPERFSSSSTNVIEEVGGGTEESEIAVDSSSGPDGGDIYVATGSQVEIYSSTGEKFSTLTEEGEPCGVAVDPRGEVYVAFYGEKAVKKYTPSTNPVTSADYTSSLSELEYHSCNIAADSTGGIYVAAYEGGVTKYEASQFNALGVAAGPGKSVDLEGTTLAVDPVNGQAYIDEQSDIAEYNSEAERATSFGEFSESFGVAESHESGDVYAADGEESEVIIFGPAPVRPEVNLEPVSEPQGTSVTLNGTVNPDGTEVTACEFEYGSTSSYGHSEPCSKAVPFSGASPVQVSAHVTELQSNTIYYFRLAATNTNGTDESEGGSFTTTGPKPTLVSVLLDGRAWEMVSSSNKHGAAIELPRTEDGGLIQASEDGNGIVYQADSSISTEPAGNRAPEPSTVISRRDQGAWSTKEVTTPNERASGTSFSTDVEYPFFSSDLSLGLVEPHGISPRSEPPLSDEASEKTIYLRHEATCETAPERCYTPLVTGKEGFANVPTGTEFGHQIEFVSATSDLSHIVLQSEHGVALTTAQVGPEGNLYEWTGGQLQLVSILPGGGATPASEPSLGDRQSENLRDAISDDGSRVFWTNEEPPSPHLYMRDTKTEKTLQIDGAEEGIEEPGGEPEVEYQTASSDGSRVFFTDTARLTKDSTLPSNPESESPQGADLYECEVVERKGEFACDLSDLTADPHDGETAAVQGSVIGADEEGSDVYFVANGALAPGATPGNCARDIKGKALPGATCNLYVEHYNSESGKWEAPTFIATLSNEDISDWESKGGAEHRSLGYVTAGVSPNGRYLAFMSEQRLAGYDNDDVNSGQPDEEVFLYDASSGHLVCASCNSTGARPLGVFDTQNAGEGTGLLVDRSLNWEGHWLAGSLPGWMVGNHEYPYHQPRYLSDSGRLFFNSPDALVPHEVEHREEGVDGQSENVGVENVYEYEPGGLGSCTDEGGCVGLVSSGTSNKESAFLDASASGDDAFFVTYAQLVPQDVDSSLDVYDASVCGISGVEQCTTSEASETASCPTVEACRGASFSQPVFGAPASATVSGRGNLAPVIAPAVRPKKTLTRAQELTKALKVCRKKANKKKRATCERRARKRYGAKASKKKSGKRSRKGKE